MALDYQTNNPISRKSCTMNNRIILYSMIDILFFLFFFFCRFLTVLFNSKLYRISFFTSISRIVYFLLFWFLIAAFYIFIFFSLFCFYIISCFHIFICVRSIFGMIHSYEDIYIYAKSEFTKIFKMHMMIHKKHHNIAFNISRS